MLKRTAAAAAEMAAKGRYALRTWGKHFDQIGAVFVDFSAHRFVRKSERHKYAIGGDAVALKPYMGNR
ncbi:hypothetical protein GCM10011273_24120 [Asticcacaulis endophyticus]|uniref:Uncharacterized protein n=1 Tax=Asticcacaulis endophyticus TaxID=1395890 RepID=A0A918UVC0_9CAUL|nr:hypothetical protein GCM10011273_24120 [Asticcacaulis endophyticus]